LNSKVAPISSGATACTLWAKKRRRSGVRRGIGGLDGRRISPAHWPPGNNTPAADHDYVIDYDYDYISH
jgi:hypothetical protein